jgi:hypothetical protein
MKGQDILLLFKITSLEAQEAWLSPPAQHSGTDSSASRLQRGIPVADATPPLYAEAHPAPAENYSLRSLAASLGISKSEISNSIARCRAAGLLVNDYETDLPKVNRGELLRITEHALKYFFPVKPGALSRGTTTGFAAPVLAVHLKSAGDTLPVWPDPEGAARGQAVEPLYKTVVHAVKQDEVLFQYLALVDAIRLGGPRESGVAVKLLKKGMGL